MILSFLNTSKNTARFFETGKSKEIPSEIQRTALRKLLILEAAHSHQDLRNPPGNRLEKLSGNLEGFYSIRINDQWRIIFKFEDGNAFDVYIDDYH